MLLDNYSEACRALDLIAKKLGYYLNQNEKFTVLGIGGLDTEKTKRVSLELRDNNYDTVKKRLHCQFYRHETGRVELNYYIS